MYLRITTMIMVLCCFWSIAVVAQSVFIEISDTTVTDNGDGYGSAWGDFDNDGDLDLFLTRTGFSSNILFKNDSDNVFVDVSADFGIVDLANSRGIVWGDYDNDGDSDLLVSQSNGLKLLRNDINLFTDVTTAANLTDGINAYSAVWVDFDNDGDLDCYATNFDGPDRLFRNTNGIFDEIANQVGLTSTSYSRAASWGDFDNDGDQDLYVCRGTSSSGLMDYLFENNNGFFTEVASARGIDQIYYSLGSAWGDFDNDGDLDLAVATADSQRNLLFRNDDGNFAEISLAIGISDSIGNSFSPTWVDYDNDGDLDLFISSDTLFSNLLYQNNSGNFTPVQSNAGIDKDTGRSIGVAWGDYNNDGFYDVYLPNRFGSNSLFRNEGNANNWLTVNCNGQLNSNGSAIGARLRLVSGPTVQIREINGGSGQSTMSAHPIVFGLGPATTVDTLQINWPGSDSLTILTNIAVNQQLMLSEPVQKQIVSVEPGEIVAGRTENFTIETLATQYLTDSIATVWLTFNVDTIFADTILVVSDLLVQAEFTIGDNAARGEYTLGVVSRDANTIKLEMAVNVVDPPLVPRFSNVAPALNLDDTGDGFGAAWIDYDNDGDLDLFLAKTLDQDNRLYRNNGNGSFSDVASSIGLAWGGRSRSGVWGDFDHDGDLDLLVSEFTGTQLMKNNDGIFTNISTASGFANSDNTYSAAWADYDKDGDLDVFTTNFSDSARLFRNDEGIFLEVTSAVGISAPSTSRAAVWADFDSDGDQDLYICRGVSNQDQPDHLYQNDNGIFTNIASTIGITAVDYSLGADWADYDNDGDLDLYVTTADAQPNCFYINENLQLVESAAALGVDNSIGVSFSPSWIDFDNDGDLDLFVTREEGYGNLFYENTGGSLAEIQDSIGLGGDTGRSIGLSWADYDRDGFLDVFITNRYGQNYLYKNGGNSSKWINLNLVGDNGSDASAIGAQATVVTGNKRQFREVNGGLAKGSQNSMELEFGLGSSTIIDSLIIYWPATNIRHVYTNLASNQFLKAYESNTVVAIGSNPKMPDEFTISYGYPNPFNPVVKFDYQIAKPGPGIIRVYNVLGQLVRTLVDKIHDAGTFQTIWDARNDQGKQVTSGIYFLRFEANNTVIMRKITLLK